MSKGKLAKFEAMKSMSNVFQNFSWHEPRLINHLGNEVQLKGQWHEQIFGNNHPIVLELACGYGEYTVGMAQKRTDQNFIGIDIKGNRIYTGAQQILDQRISNAVFLRSSIELLPHFFDTAEVNEIWIPFPDPFRRDSKSNRRLTSPYFLDLYRQFVVPNGIIHLKTDSDILYEFTLQTIAENGCTLLESHYDLYQTAADNELLDIKTRYERLNLSGASTFKYIKFSL